MLFHFLLDSQIALRGFEGRGGATGAHPREEDGGKGTLMRIHFHKHLGVAADCSTTKRTPLVIHLFGCLFLQD